MADWQKQVEKEAAAVLGGKPPVIIPREIATPANVKRTVEDWLSRWGHPEHMLIVTPTDEGTRIERSSEP